MKSAIMDAGLLILILVGTAGAEGTAQLTNELSQKLQQLPQSFSFSTQAASIPAHGAAPVNAIRVRTVSTHGSSEAPPKFQPRSATPLTAQPNVRVSSFTPAVDNADSGLTRVADHSQRVHPTGTSEANPHAVRFSPPITYANKTPVVSTASARSVSTTTYAPVVEIPNEGTIAAPTISPAPNAAPAFQGSTGYGVTPVPTLEPSYTVPPAGIQVAPPTTTTIVPSYAYRPVATWVEMPKTVYVGRGIIGQPTVYVPKQPVRNFFRFLSP